MKTNKFKNRLKLGIFAVSLLSYGLASAQQTTGDVTKEANIIHGTTTTGGAVKVIDNKGTIKYLQSKNGITMLTNTTADITTTTWQLGGTLTDSTFIDVASAAFGLDGIDLITTESAATAATTKADHSVSGPAGSGWTILVRDEATGATKKLLATDLITSGQTVFTVVNDDDVAFDVSLAPASPLMAGAQIPLPDFSKVWVYRNGAKLIANVDYSIATSIVTLLPKTTAPNIWTTYADDIIEVQYIK